MKNFLNETLIKVRWVDIDCYSHLNNAKYFDFMVETRADILDSFSKEIPSVKYILIDTQCSFKKEVKYPSSIFVKQYCDSVSHTTFELSYEFFEDKKQEIVALGKAKLVCFETLKNKITKIPEQLLKKLISK